MAHPTLQTQRAQPGLDQQRLARVPQRVRNWALAPAARLLHVVHSGSRAIRPLCRRRQCRTTESTTGGGSRIASSSGRSLGGSTGPIARRLCGATASARPLRRASRQCDPPSSPAYDRWTTYVWAVSDESLVIDVLAAAATTAAVVVALWASHRSLRLARRGLQVEGRRQAAVDIARWLQEAEAGVLGWHDETNWRVPGDVEFGPESGIEPGDILPPSQGRMGPSIEAAIRQFEPVRGLARLAFGPRHEVTQLVGEVIEAVQHIADRGVIYAEEQGTTPREYVDRTFRPLAADLFEALAEACELRDPEERVPRSGVRARDRKPAGYR